MASKILRKHGIKITQYGGSHRIDITPDVLKNFDVIISIGKTVQYAMAMGIPIYNYDHFGGSGYITPENIDIEEASNFSGRSFYTKKTPQQIANEIMSQYEKVCNQCTVLQKIAEIRYKQSIRIQEILKLVDTVPEHTQLTETPDNKLLFDYCEFIIEHFILHTEPKVKRLLRHLKTMKF